MQYSDIVKQQSLHHDIHHMAFDLILTTNELHNLKHHGLLYVLIQETERFINLSWNDRQTPDEIRSNLKAYLIDYTRRNVQF